MDHTHVNSKEYWEHRFQMDWEAMQGREQSRFFAKLALDHLPSWFFTLARVQRFTFCDWGCAEGDGTDVLGSYFGRDRVYGIDFSETAVEKARNRYKDLEFLREDWLTESVASKSYDVVFSSNTLEHFKRPYEVLRSLLTRADKCVVLLLPYREFERQLEHNYTFLAENIPCAPDTEFFLTYSQAIGTSDLVPTYWSGQQMLLIYARARFLRESGLTLADARVHDELEMVMREKILEVERSLATRDGQITSLTQSVTEREAQINDLTQTLIERDHRIAAMSQQMQVIEGSRSWRITRPLREIRRTGVTVKRKVRNAVLLMRTRGLRHVLGHIENKMRSKARPETYYHDQLNRILEDNQGKPVIVFRPVVDWNLPLFQRPQHIAKRLADEGFLFFYCTVNGFDSIDGFEQVHPGCYVTNQFEIVDQLPGLKIIHLYAADPKCSWEYIQKHKEAGDVVIYEYIDEIHVDIAGREVAQGLLDRHSKVLQTDEIACIASAEKLYRKAARNRTRNVVLVTNGVELDHFLVSRDRSKIPPDMRKVVAKGKCIIGYFGALATWFDYELVVELARAHPEYEILLIGWDYDKSLKSYPIGDYSNITVIGPIDYNILPQYACWFDVSTIPFRINEVTESTSPIKLFEYMALGHPIVTTDLPECRKYRSVLIGRDHSEFIRRVEEALGKREDQEYLAILKREAMENTWQSKAKQISDVIRENMVSNPHWTRTIPYQDDVLDAVQEEIAACYLLDKPGGHGYYETAYRAEERFYWFPVLDWIRNFKSVKRVVDIGVAYGTLLLYVIKCHKPDYALAVDAIGDISPTLLKRYNIQYLNRDIERSALDSCGKFDLIIFTETLEHLNFNAAPTLNKLRRMLTQDGYLILTTPDALEWGRVTKYYPSIDAIPEYTGQDVEWIDGHVWQYTREEVEALVENAGFTVVKFAYARGMNGRHLCFLLRPSGGPLIAKN